VPPLASDFVEATTWEPFGDVPEEREEVDSEETRGKQDVELICRLIGNADQVVVLRFGPISVGYPENNDTDCPKIRVPSKPSDHYEKGVSQ
jgi:hypothetical protein